jgi:hypothetical protein
VSDCRFLSKQKWKEKDKESEECPLNSDNFLYKRSYDLPKTYSWTLSTAAVWLTNALHEEALAAAGKIFSLKYLKIFNNFLPICGRYME